MDIFSLGVLKCVVCFCSGYDGCVFSVCIVRRGVVSCVHPVAVLNVAFCMT